LRRCASDGSTFTALRRLQLAAESGGGLGVIFRRSGAAETTSAASLRLVLRSHGDTVEVTLLKARGGRPGCVQLDLAELSGAAP